jgi:catechol 2,3-dioxygenase-like lactoylglutathione lyase family enzyme
VTAFGTNRSPLWPAQLDHIVRTSDRPEALLEFYRDGFGMAPRRLAAGSWVVEGPRRRLIVAPGARGSQPLSAFRVGNVEQLRALRAYVGAQGIDILASPSPLFGEAFAVRDPDGRLAAFGLVDPAQDSPAASDLAAARLPGRLQHVVVATTRLKPLIEFYGALGFVESDHVWEDEIGPGEVTATFLRSDPEHHSLAAFRGPEIRPDHHCYETTCWNDIRDWADHLAAQRVKLWWGPGRHGPGNNLFFMVEDPDGYKVELSAELELMAREAPPRSWRHEERTLNYWGQAWMRS